MKHILITFAAALTLSLTLHAQTPYGTPKTILDFLQMSDSDTTTCILSGVVTKITSNAGNLYLRDDTAQVYIYGLIDPLHPNFGFRQFDIMPGDTLTVCGRRVVFKDIIEMTSARLVRKANGPDHDTPIKLDKEPSFKGKTGKECDQAFGEWVHSHLKHPAGYEDVHTAVKVQFVVGVNGGVQEVQVIKGAARPFNEEAVRVVSSSPRWKPAVLYGKPLRTKHRIVVEF